MKIPMKPRINTANNTLLAFSTPIQQMRFENSEPLNAEVARRVLEMRDRMPSQQYSNVGGWHSDSNFLQNLGEPYGSQLAWMFMRAVYAAVDSVVEMTDVPPIQPIMECWANVNQRGDSNQPHIHAGSPWSGVYYVATEANARGEIFFTDPRAAALMSNHPLNPFGTTSPITIVPVPGTMLVFPSFLQHGVHPYQGDSPRISIAFNLM